MADVDTSKWSNEGTFTQVLIDRLRAMDAIAFVAVEDAPATRSEADYNFISNEIFVSFASQSHTERSRWLGVVPVTRQVSHKAMTIDGLGNALSALPEVGSPDYADESMLQYLKTERIIPPYQTRGYKLVELVRVYEVGTVPRA